MRTGIVRKKRFTALSVVAPVWAVDGLFDDSRNAAARSARERASVRQEAGKVCLGDVPVPADWNTMRINSASTKRRSAKRACCVFQNAGPMFRRGSISLFGSSAIRVGKMWGRLSKQPCGARYFVIAAA
jgi:hypothetical protein